MTTRRPLRPGLLVSALVLATAIASRALAEPASPPPAARPSSDAAPPPSASVDGSRPPAPPLAESLTGGAKADYDAGKLLYVDGDFAGALVKFTAAHAKAGDPRLLWNMATCEKNLRRYSNVLALVRRYLAQGEAVLTPADKVEAETLLKALEPLTVALELVVSEPGAKVYVDEALVGETPLAAPVVIDIGTRKIRVTKDGFEDFHEAVVAGDAPKVKLVATLDKVVHEATLAITARPREEIYLDGVLRGLGTWRGLVPSGGHTVRVTAPEMRAYQAEVFLRDKESRVVAVTLEKDVQPAGPLPAWLWIGGGALVLSSAAVVGYLVFKPEDKPPTLPVGTLDPGSVQASFRFGR